MNGIYTRLQIKNGGHASICSKQHAMKGVHDLTFGFHLPLGEGGISEGGKQGRLSIDMTFLVVLFALLLSCMGVTSKHKYYYELNITYEYTYVYNVLKQRIN